MSLTRLQIELEEVFDSKNLTATAATPTPALPMARVDRLILAVASPEADLAQIFSVQEFVRMEDLKNSTKKISPSGNLGSTKIENFTCSYIVQCFLFFSRFFLSHSISSFFFGKIGNISGSGINFDVSNNLFDKLNIALIFP